MKARNKRKMRLAINERGVVDTRREVVLFLQKLKGQVILSARDSDSGAVTYLLTFHDDGRIERDEGIQDVFQFHTHPDGSLRFTDE